MNRLPPDDANLETRLRAYYQQRRPAPPPDSAALWVRLAPRLDGLALTSTQAEYEERLRPLLSLAEHVTPSALLPAPAAPPASRRRFVTGISSLAAALVVVLLVVSIFAFFSLTPRKTSSPVLVLDRSKIALLSTSMVSASEGWAVGNNGIIMHYTNGAWTMAQSPIGENLSSITMVSPSEGWAIGAHGTILHYQNGVWSLYQGS